MITIQIHIANQEPIKLDVEELPDPGDNVIIGKNPRDRKDQEVIWVDEGVNTLIMPWWRINYIQVMPSGETQLDFPLPYRE